MTPTNFFLPLANPAMEAEIGTVYSQGLAAAYAHIRANSCLSSRSSRPIKRPVGSYRTKRSN